MEGNRLSIFIIGTYDWVTFSKSFIAFKNRFKKTAAMQGKQEELEGAKNSQEIGCKIKKVSYVRAHLES